MSLPPELLTVLNARAICFLTTLMPDGSPQTSQTWVGTDGEHIVINTVDTHQKTRNIRRDPRVSVGIADPESPLNSWAVRGRVVAAELDGAREHIDELSRKYLGRPYPDPAGGRGGNRIKLTIAAEKVHIPRG